MSKRKQRKQRAAPSASALSPWKQVAFSLTAVLLFFGLLEAALFVAGVRPALGREDPFVGFVSNVPLFVLDTDADGEALLVTAPNKRAFFNEQRFPARKAAGTYRIFCLGGSTTYGRPYDDSTSFVGWLREILPAADPSRRWEVINAGGISYASYRVATLMEELARYQPDLFVVYSGHNEFLEERSYRSLRSVPGPLRRAAALAAKSRTWTALRGVVDAARVHGEHAEREPHGGGRFLLPETVDARLDHSAGPEAYRRDDALREAVILHYGISLERMVRIARAAGAEIVFVTPAANLRDCTPFKSQHTDGLTDERRRRSRRLLAEARAHARDERWDAALRSAEEALTIDGRFAELHFRRGQALFATGRHEAAAEAFRRARDEDVCPLRALTAQGVVLRDVAEREMVPRIDFVGRLEERLAAERGHRIPGAETFLDHVHPTVEGHRLLALALLDWAVERGIAAPSPAWGPTALAEVVARVEARLDGPARGRALANLAKTLAWAGKDEDSRRLAFQALATGHDDPTILMMVATHHRLDGDEDAAWSFLRRALRARPSNPMVHLQLGLTLQDRGDLEAAAGHFLLASQHWPDYFEPHYRFGNTMARRRSYAAALPFLGRALELNPRHELARRDLVLVRQRLGAASPARGAAIPRTRATRSAEGALRTLEQIAPGPGGEWVRDGVWTEWHEDGGLRALVEYRAGTAVGPTHTWRPDGQRETPNAGTRAPARNPGSGAS